MKKTLNTIAVSIAAMAAISAFAGAQQSGQSCCGGMMSMHQKADGIDKATQAKQYAHKQTATVVISGGYSPAAIEVKKGKPVELTFIGGKEIGCGGTVVFESLKISKDVAVGKSVVIRFTPKDSGEIPFTCGMGMLHGTVIVK